MTHLFFLANPDRLEDSLYPKDLIQRLWIDMFKGLCELSQVRSSVSSRQALFIVLWCIRQPFLHSVDLKTIVAIMNSILTKNITAYICRVKILFFLPRK